jgi:hypothetical protein
MSVDDTFAERLSLLVLAVIEEERGAVASVGALVALIERMALGLTLPHKMALAELMRDVADRLDRARYLVEVKEDDAR